MNRDPAQHPHIISKRKSEPAVAQNAPKRQKCNTCNFVQKTSISNQGKGFSTKKGKKRNKTHNKLVVDREQYLLIISKRKRNQQQEKPRSTDKNATPTIFDRNQQQQIRARNLAKQKVKKVKKD